MTKWKGRAASIAPGLLSVSVVALSAGLAYAQPVMISTTETTPRTVNDDVDVTVTATGSVALVGETSEQAIEIDVLDYAADALIQGTLSYLGGTASATPAAGLWLTGDLSGTITNQGVITLDVQDTDDVTLYGIKVDGDVAGTITNAGTISVIAKASTADASANGIGVFGTLSGTIRNDGVITADALSGTESASAWGIYVSDVTGTALIENNGTITARAYTFTSEAEAYGIEVDGDLVAGARIVNNGVIDVEAESVTYSAYGYGIYVDGDAAGDITNTGTIHAAARGANTTADTMEAYGIYVDDSLSGTITNDGLIEVEVSTLANQYDITAAGIYVGDVVAGGVIANNSTITVDARSEGITDTSTIAGIWVDGPMDGTVTNDGSITVTVDAGAMTSSEAYVYGILSDGTMGGSISNSGTIDVAVSATVVDDGLEIYGISTDGNDISGDITNSGNITVAGSIEGSSSLDDVTVWGIEGGNVLTGGMVSNSGTIDVRATATALNTASTAMDARAYGIDLDDIDGTVSNDGTITVAATASGSATNSIEASAYGINAGDVNGDLSNDGSINVTASASGSASDSISASAYGMDLSTINGTVSNDGTISVTASASGWASDDISAYAYGIDAGDVNGDLSNDGSINVTATASGTATSDSIYAVAYGMDLGTIGVTGTVSNDGGIVVAATADGYGTYGVSAYAYGIDASSVDGDLSNDGSINVTATASGTATSAWVWASAYGMDLGTIGGTGTVSNDGSIVVAATADGSGWNGVGASAYGIAAWGDVDGSLSNDGSINVTASASGTSTSGSIYATAYGIHADDDVNGSLSNGGSIAVTASASGSGSTGLYAEANGIVADDVNGSLSNGGSIDVTATASGWASSPVSAFAYGVTMDTVGGAASVSNTGRIVVTASASNDNTAGGTSSEAVGIDIDTLDGTLFNSGLVMASVANGTAAGGDEVYAVRVGGGGGDATFTTESFLAGRLALNDSVAVEVQSVADTGSIYWDFENRLANSITLVDTNGPTLYYDSTNNIVATVEPANLAFSGLFAAEFAGTGYGAVTSLMSGMPATGAAVMNRGNGGPTVFFQGDYRSMELDDRLGRTLDFDTAGATAGVVGQFDNRFSYGVTLSGVRADGSVPSVFGAADTVETSGVVLGAYGNMDLGALTLTFGGSAGMLSNEGTRSMNDNLALDGVGTVSSSYDSTFFSPAVELSTIMQSGAMTIRPYAGYRYTSLSVDGFTETGGNGAATFGSRDVTVSDITIGADASMPYGSGVLTGSAEILRRDVSDDGANVVLFGMNGHTASAATDYTALELGVGYGMTIGSGTLDVGVSATFGTNDVSGYGLTAGYSVKF